MDLKWGIILEFIVEVKCQTVDCSSAVSGYGREAGCCKMVVNFQFPFRQECRGKLSYHQILKNYSASQSCQCPLCPFNAKSAV